VAARAWSLGQAHQTASHELGQYLIAADRRQPRDASASTGHDDLDTLLDAIEVLAQAIVQGADANLLFVTTM